MTPNRTRAEQIAKSWICNGKPPITPHEIEAVKTLTFIIEQALDEAVRDRCKDEINAAFNEGIEKAADWINSNEWNGEDLSDNIRALTLNPESKSWLYPKWEVDEEVKDAEKKGTLAGLEMAAGILKDHYWDSLTGEKHRDSLVEMIEAKAKELQ